MRQFLLPLLSILLLTACQKEINTPKAGEVIAGNNANKQSKTSVCHYDAVTGTYKTVIVTDPKALAAHLKHGDIQGECPTIQTVTICDQVWMAKNLDITTYRDGTAIPEVKDQTEWASATEGAWCYYNNDPLNGPIYGKLYNWYAVNDPRGLAPAGWHIPTEIEWFTLIQCLGGPTAAGGAMKSVGTIEDGTGLWYAPNTAASNSSGFTGTPSGFRDVVSTGLLGAFTYWWSSTDIEVNSSPISLMVNYLDGVSTLGGAPKAYGLSVRCVKD